MKPNRGHLNSRKIPETGKSNDLLQLDDRYMGWVVTCSHKWGQCWMHTWLGSLKYQIPFFQEKICHGFLRHNFLDMSPIKKRKSQANEAWELRDLRRKQRLSLAIEEFSNSHCCSGVESESQHRADSKATATLYLASAWKYIRRQRKCKPAKKGPYSSKFLNAITLDLQN